MVPNKYPVFTVAPIIGIAEISTANTARDGSGTIINVVTGPEDGTRIDQIFIKAIVSTTAGMIRLFLADDQLTPNIVLWKEILVTAITASATVATFEASVNLQGETALILPNGYSLMAATEKAEAFNIIAKGGVYS